MPLALLASIAYLTVFQIPPAAQRDIPPMLVSRQLSEAAGVRAGDLARIAVDASGTNAREVRIAGIYEPVPDPSRLNASKHEVRLHLPDLLAITAASGDPLALEHVDAISIALVDGVDPGRFSRDLAAVVPGITARPVGGANEQVGLFVVLERFHLAIAIVTVLASTVFLLALSVMLVDERRETIGVLRLIGLTSRRILAQILVEGMLIAAAGSVFGLGLAAASQGPINRFFQWKYDTALVFVRITPEVARQCLLIAVPLGVAGSIAASWALVRRKPLGLVGR